MFWCCKSGKVPQPPKHQFSLREGFPFTEHIGEGGWILCSDHIVWLVSDDGGSPCCTLHMGEGVLFHPSYCYVGWSLTYHFHWIPHSLMMYSRCPRFPTCSTWPSWEIWTCAGWGIHLWILRTGIGFIGPIQRASLALISHQRLSSGCTVLTGGSAYRATALPWPFYEL